MRNSIFLFLFVFIRLQLSAQAPDWSVNASNFQYSMTITSFLSVNGVTLTNANDKLGAFVNNEKRGEANVVYNANADKYLVYLTVYANSSGETINFKIYDSQNNQIVDLQKSIIFSINGNVGGVFQSESMANPVLAKDAEFLTYDFQNIAEVSSTITEDEVIIFLPQNTLVSNLVPEFTTKNNGKVYVNQKLQTSGQQSLDFTNDLLYQVLSEDESVLKSYTVKVTVLADANNPSAVLSTSIGTFTKEKLLNVNLTFSEEIVNLSKEDFTLTNAFIKSVTSQNNKDFSLEVLAINQGLVTIQLKENSIQDLQNNTNAASNILETTVDFNEPKISEITPDGINFSITFSEDVTNVGVSDFVLFGEAKDAYTINELEKVSNKNYLLKLTEVQTNSQGNVYPMIVNSSIQDNAGNLLVNQTFEEYLKNVVLSSENLLIEEMVSIYPNPTVQYLDIKLKNHILKEIVLYDLQGKHVRSIQKINKEYQKIDLSYLSNTIYLIKIKTLDDKIFLKKIIKN